MADLSAKVELAVKGQSAYIPVKGLLVTLKWSSGVDLDLMAFFETKSGKPDGVFTDLLGGSLGNMNAYPWMLHTGDAGVKAKPGEDKAETLKVAKLDDIKQMYIVCLNYTDAAAHKDAVFANYDGGVVVQEVGTSESFSVPLKSTERGAIAVICRIDNTNPMGPQLVNENQIMSLTDFFEKIPGANLLAKKN